MPEDKRIIHPGSYMVTIRAPRWELLEEKDGDSARMVAILPGYCEAGHIDGYLYFTRGLIGSGKNQGRSLYEVSKEQLIELGMPEPFNPANLHQLDGAQCEFVVKLEEYKGETRAKVAFINSGRREQLDGDQAAAIWGALAGEKKPQPAAAPAGEGLLNDNEDLDDLPF